MVDFSIPAEVFIYILDLFGTMAFAVTGAFKAIESKADIVGIVILATITGVAGGTIRDIVLGRFPPNSIMDPSYVVITVVTGVVLFFLYSKLKKHWNVFLKFDAIGLGVFTVIGATFAYNIFGLNFLAMVLAGMLTAVGGGILRDVDVVAPVRLEYGSCIRSEQVAVQCDERTAHGIDAVDRKHRWRTDANAVAARPIGQILAVVAQLRRSRVRALFVDAVVDGVEHAAHEDRTPYEFGVAVARHLLDAVKCQVRPRARAVEEELDLRHGTWETSSKR